jgi:hypothetical protein
MKALFLSELYRFRTHATISFIVYIFVLMMVNNNDGLVVLGGMQHAVMLYLPSCFAFILAITQMASYKSISRWTYLIHRPLKLTQVMSSLWLAGFTLLTAVFVIPVFIIYACIDLLQLEVFESRYYFWLLNIWAYILNFYLIGFITSLYPHKMSLSLLFVPVIWYSLDVFPELGLVNHGMLFIILVGLYGSVVKPDIESTSLSKTKSMIFGVSLQAGLYISLGIVFFFLTSILLATSNRNIATESRFYNSESKDKFEVMLAQMPSDESSYLSSEIALAKITKFSMRRSKTINNQTFGQPHYRDLSGALYNPTSKQYWMFNHGSRQFEKLIHANNEQITVIDKGQKSTSLDFVPMVNERFVYDQASVWLFDPHVLNLYNKYSVDNGEMIVPPFKQTSSYLWLLTTENIQMFLQGDVQYNGEAMSPLISSKLPEAYEQLDSIEIGEISDGYLYLLTYANQAIDLGMMQKPEPIAGSAYLIHAKFDGSSRMLTQYDIPNHTSIWSLWSNYLVSPLFAYVEYELKTPPGSNSLNDHVPKPIWIYAGALTIIVMLLTAGLLRHTQLRIREKLLWLVFSAIGGIPGLLASWLLLERKITRKAKLEVAKRKVSQPQFN